eukprot:TRINITY_DN37410_c0_g1_i1.p1 TRINITY_DN37410_c0_g1~~TRINITY_DN37410_c0_g1_i1.p1  ORF type:complete len:481 (+),score=86.86 TRINITY_DN37410_c0_g1_i1:3-1445(+)
MGIIEQAQKEKVQYCQQKEYEALAIYNDLAKEHSAKVMQQAQKAFESLQRTIDEKVNQTSRQKDDENRKKVQSLQDSLEEQFVKQMEIIEKEQQRLADKEKQLDEEHVAAELNTRVRYEQLLREWRADLQQDFDFMKAKLQEDRARLEEEHGRELLRITQERLEYERLLREQHEKDKEQFMAKFNNQLADQESLFKQELQTLTERSHHHELEVKQECLKYEEEIRSHYMNLLKEKEELWREHESRRMQTATEIWAEMRKDLLQSERQGIDEQSQLFEQLLKSKYDQVMNDSYYNDDREQFRRDQFDGDRRRLLDDSVGMDQKLRSREHDVERKRAELEDYYRSRSSDNAKVPMSGSWGPPSSDNSGYHNKPSKIPRDTSSHGKLSRPNSFDREMANMDMKLAEQKQERDKEFEHRIRRAEDDLKRKYEDRYSMLEKALHQEIDSFNRRIKSEREKYMSTGMPILPSLLSPTKPPSTGGHP